MKTRLLNTRNKIVTPSSGTTNHVDYAEHKQVLEIAYTGGKTYHYYNVDLNVWNEYRTEVLNGGSSGVFVNTRIKPVYHNYEQIY
ncbi:KTSC domain-containing protein [Desertivirga xinjiangensis]|uniref:KTSC domain-containing protein n=1 Tax=Desertivirga xinjiangensis TaxID=539206 RepID=UPI00210C99D4|nr:KTSC domain-containing protein [Pedobacter xinjiangensis]